MTLTLRGRLETRLLLGMFIGLPCGVCVACAWRWGTEPAKAASPACFAVLVMIVLGLCWEPVYHAISTARPDQDWPALFALCAIAIEAVPLWFVLHGLGWNGGGEPLGCFLASVGAAGAAMWLVAQGPLRVLLLRWRLTGGQCIGCWWDTGRHGK